MSKQIKVSTIIPEVPDNYLTLVGEENRGILDQLRKITKEEMSKIYQNKDHEVRLNHSEERILRKKKELEALKIKAYTGQFKSNQDITPLRQRIMRRATTEQAEVKMDKFDLLNQTLTRTREEYEGKKPI